MNARFNRSISLLAGAALVALSTTGTAAFAKKKKAKADKGADAAPATIEETDISAIDDVFKPAADILTSLNGAN